MLWVREFMPCLQLGYLENTKFVLIIYSSSHMQLKYYRVNLNWPVFGLVDRQNFIRTRLGKYFDRFELKKKSIQTHINIKHLKSQSFFHKSQVTQQQRLLAYRQMYKGFCRKSDLAHRRHHRKLQTTSTDKTSASLLQLFLVLQILEREF